MISEEFRRIIRDVGLLNSLSWMLDVYLGEDDWQVRKEHTGENLNEKRKMAIYLLRMRGQFRKDSLRYG
jgi:predicted transposase YbfD/YdcC